MNHYEIIIYWSNEDQAFLAEVPELPGCMAHGNSYEEALRNVGDAMALWLDAAREQGESIPIPKGRRLMYA
ncbi:MAG TPA: type II toxin-antitoxin system HicB family antitoxin [Candidatus Competibacter sp.]|nr:type II toxin-antitoxin system HicB family antitoxin [Gammaproteobacteria bacterium]HPE71818.1 type II toxin-antitoxin system HicB family antitoxin [Candidatus Competibacter sp.]HRX63278.1 type II toxin-antitoxin system HicB family antitoxin [Candidatus Competibacter sp.]